MKIDISRLGRYSLDQIVELAEEKDMTVETLVIQALRLYHSTDLHLKNGETCTWSGDAQRARDFVGEL